jgi:serine/threonine protein phosphatase PrpC
MLDVQFGQASDFGKVRTNNEDAMGSFIPASRQQARSHGYLFAVADGVGGMDLGEVASATAISVHHRGVRQSPGRHHAHQPAAAPHSARQRRRPRLHPGPPISRQKMATTLVACAMRHDQAIVSHVGDSRCYLVRNGRPSRSLRTTPGSTSSARWA